MTKATAMPAITALLGRVVIILGPTKWNISMLRFCFKKTSFQIMFASCCAILDIFQRFIKFVSSPLAATLFLSILSSDHQIRIAKFSTMAAKKLWFLLKFRIRMTVQNTNFGLLFLFYIFQLALPR